MKKLALVLALVGISFVSQSFKSSESPKDSISKVQSDQSKIEAIDSLIKSRFGESMKIDSKFEIGCENTIKEREEGVKIPFVKGQAHLHYYAGAKGSLPNTSTLIEVFNERFDNLKNLDLPMTPDSYFVKIVISGDMHYMVIGIDGK